MLWRSFGLGMFLTIRWNCCEMSIKDKYYVDSIDSRETYDWLLNKHYAKRVPQIVSSFGLYKEELGYKTLIGVCTYGLPPSST